MVTGGTGSEPFDTHDDAEPASYHTGPESDVGSPVKVMQESWREEHDKTHNNASHNPRKVQEDRHFTILSSFAFALKNRLEIMKMLGKCSVMHFDKEGMRHEMHADKGLQILIHTEPQTNFLHYDVGEGGAREPIDNDTALKLMKCAVKKNQVRITNNDPEDAYIYLNVVGESGRTDDDTNTIHMLRLPLNQIPRAAMLPVYTCPPLRVQSSKLARDCGTLDQIKSPSVLLEAYKNALVLSAELDRTRAGKTAVLTNLDMREEDAAEEINNDSNQEPIVTFRITPQVIKVLGKVASQIEGVVLIYVQENLPICFSGNSAHGTDSYYVHDYSSEISRKMTLSGKMRVPHSASKHF